MKNHKTILSVTISMLAFTAGSATCAQPTPTSRQQMTAIATRSLVLQPGDELVFEKSLFTPIVFRDIPNERTFTRQLIVRPKQGKLTTASARVQPLTAKKSAFVEEYVIDVPASMTEGELAAILLATGDYESVEPNWLRYPAVVPNDSQFASSWQHTRLESSAAWDIMTGNSNVIIAVCDSGIDLDHPDLVASLVPGYNSASDLPQAEGGNVEDINGHGTFVAGCAAARGNNSSGVVGVGWNFSIMPIRVTNNNNGTASSFNITEGARWAAAHGAKIINASFSGGTSSSNQAAGRRIKNDGGLLFWAAGNDNRRVSPNRTDYVLVSSTTSSDRKSGFSNFGPAVDIAAPGSSVRSTRIGGGYGNGSGTSYASPIAAGVGAMIFSVNPDFSGDDVQAILYASVDDLGAPGRDDSFGRGRVNTRRAIETAQAYIRPTLTPILETFDSNSWQDLFVATAGNIQVLESGTPSLEINDNDIVETVPLAGTSLPGTLLLSFDIKTLSIEPGDSLDIQFLVSPDIADNQWETLHTMTGLGDAQSQFIPVEIVLPDEFEWHGTKIRFVAHGSDASDTWLIDSFSIDRKPFLLTAPFEENFESERISEVRWTDAQNASVEQENNNYFLQLSDTQSMVSQNIPLDEFGFVDSYIRFDVWTNDQVSPTDELFVEAFSHTNIWFPAITITAQELSLNPKLFELDVPIPARWIPDMKLRITATTTGAFNVDNIYVGFDQLNPGCSQADLAEPFGELNFFDVAELLTAFSSGSQTADINDDGLLNFFDVADYLQLFNAGCP